MNIRRSIPDELRSIEMVAPDLLVASARGIWVPCRSENSPTAVYGWVVPGIPKPVLELHQFGQLSCVPTVNHKLMRATADCGSEDSDSCQCHRWMVELNTTGTKNSGLHLVISSFRDQYHYTEIPVVFIGEKTVRLGWPTTFIDWKSMSKVEIPEGDR